METLIDKNKLNKPLVADLEDFELASSAKLSSHFIHRSNAPVERLLDLSYWETAGDVAMRSGDTITVLHKVEPGSHPIVTLIVSGLTGPARAKTPVVKLVRIDVPRSTP